MLYFTAGPSQLYPKAKQFFSDALSQDIPSLSHRSSTFSKLFAELRTNLQTLFRVTPEYQTFYGGSATEFMERILQNCSSTETLHFVSGAFSKRFHDIATALGRNARMVAQRADGSFSLDDVPADAAPELICFTHNETSNGTKLSPAFFERVRARYPSAILATDVVSSAPCFDGVFALSDCLFFSIQKGFGLPAGLGVALVNARAREKAHSIERSEVYTGSYHSFLKLVSNAEQDRTPETPNVLAMYLLNAVCTDMNKQGIAQLQQEMIEKAGVLYEAVGHSRELESGPVSDEYRSRSVIVARAPGGSAPVIARLKEKGFLVHSGYKNDKDTHVRIANFPAHSLDDVRALASIL